MDNGELPGVFAGDNRFHPAFENVTGEENATTTGKTFDPDIRSEPDHPPFVATAGMVFPESDDITEIDFQRHNTKVIPKAGR
jgi:hypothetical protein